jgi:hypothetical protein
MNFLLSIYMLEFLTRDFCFLKKIYRHKIYQNIVYRVLTSAVFYVQKSPMHYFRVQILYFLMI